MTIIYCLTHEDLTQILITKVTTQSLKKKALKKPGTVFNFGYSELEETVQV